MAVLTIGVELAKNFFRVPGVDGDRLSMMTGHHGILGPLAIAWWSQSEGDTDSRC